LVSVALTDKEAFLPISNHTRAGRPIQLESALNDQSVDYYKAMHREDIKLNLARCIHRAADIRDVSF